MIIDVTYFDILRGKRTKTNACPVALAIKRAVNPLWRVSVIPTNVHFYHSISEYNRLIPPEVTEFIKAFDAGRLIAPFSFVLEDLPTP